MIDKWELNDYLRSNEIPSIKRWIDFVEVHFDELREKQDKIELDLSDFKINPYQLELALEEIGFEKDEDYDTNGWEMDYWIYFERNGFKIEIQGTAIIHELKLVVYLED